MTDRVLHRDALPPGSQVREFELVDVLGRGGFGITYLGWNTSLNIHVAIKEYMPVDFAVRDEDGDVCPRTEGHQGDYEWGLGKFLEEARMLARFEHNRSIVQVRQFFEAHGTAYIVMERLNGQTLYAEYESEGTLGEDRLRTLLKPILSGLEQVHAAGFRHMDIKPGNIMLRDDGTPVLIDFGAAEIAAAERSRLVQSVVMPGFSPSEQYSSTTRHHGPWTDIYALGAVLYRGMTGDVPIDAPSRVEADELVPVGEAAARRYSPSLIEAVDWALRVRATDRPRSIEAWREVLDEGGESSTLTWGPRDSDPVPQPPPDPPKQPEVQSREKSNDRDRGRGWPLKVVATVAVLAALLVLGGVWYLTDWATDPYRLEPVEEVTNKLESPRVPPEAVAALAEAKALRVRGELVQARGILGKARDAGLPEEDYLAELREIERAEAEAEAGEVSARLAECAAHRDGTRLDKALACYREVLDRAPGNVQARFEVLRLDMYAALTEANRIDTREQYQRFMDETTRKLDEYRRVDLEEEAKHLIDLAREKQQSR